MAFRNPTAVRASRPSPPSSLQLAPATARTDDVANALYWIPLSLLLPLAIAYVLTTRPVSATDCLLVAS